MTRFDGSPRLASCQSGGPWRCTEGSEIGIAQAVTQLVAEGHDAFWVRAWIEELWGASKQALHDGDVGYLRVNVAITEASVQDEVDRQRRDAEHDSQCAYCGTTNYLKTPPQSGSTLCSDCLNRALEEAEAEAQEAEDQEC